MDNKPILYGVVGFVLGVAITIFTANNAVNTNNTGMMGGTGMGSSMEEMMESMNGKTGENFDRAFIDAMTIHHQGAIEMAKEAKQSAGRAEIKSMADDIIVAQTNEIEMMQQWRSQWRY
ncbi:hypothetical protein A2875_00520 [Candidatus Gottesmanbacteria bacterium RIFCSPHIGHO2_01_FULL_46_14]|uniref:DUF305 domain-containing protein n=2 Tax=Patescibacteria group TaxID=1783273 RepID=A0A1F5ZKZ3_9BACT|nr:MAG: hypothetical protein UW78_C0018G0013 [Candidatus Azambacteria bacterium GW2011_GWA1_44_9]OGG13081.1 MAG: hypothetical protein A2875_00520 [Candidatus Gottesmanbacteria bacterium RIFCSPHIGHO2_01_FULL_46_14]